MALDGMGMMLKALGIDPASLQEGLQTAEAKITAVETSLTNINRKLDLILSHLGIETQTVVKFVGSGGSTDASSNQN